MVWSGNGPPEKEHPLTTIGACLALMLVGYFLTKWGWHVLDFGGTLAEETGHRTHRRHGGGFFLIGGGMGAVGLAFLGGGVWWMGKAVVAMVRGEMVE